MRQKVLAFLALASFAVAFGGFTFYVSIVVPVGTEILGSSRAQGEITQQVTHWLNGFTGIAVGLMLVEWWTCSVREKSPTQSLSGWPRIELAAILFVALCLITLVILHPIMDQFIEGEPRKIRVVRRGAFYQWHRVYLWVSTLQWLAAWIWLMAWVRRTPVLR